MAGEIPLYCAAGPDTRLLFLGDILPLPGGFASAGDLLLAVGAFFCILCLMRPRKILHWWIKTDKYVARNERTFRAHFYRNAMQAAAASVTNARKNPEET